MRNSRIVAGLVLAIVAVASVALAALPAGGTFTDDNGNPHEPNIEAIAAAGITKGCNPPVNDHYCPHLDVTRAEMAAFLLRGIGEDGNLPSFQGYFTDVPAGQWFTPNVERLFELGISTGYADGTYRPGNLVTRGEMAAFILRALGEDTNVIPYRGLFADVASTAWYALFAERLYDLEITTGCETAPLRYCPNGAVKRDQMASFLARALGLQPIVPPPPPTTTTLPPEFTFGDGMWRVGADIPAGTYRNTDSSGFCYGARLSGFGGSFDEIITNELSYNIMIVTLSPGDAGFESNDCGTWTNTLTPRTATPTSNHGDGYWLVGTEVAPGLWRNSDSSNLCYWERLSGFSWSFDGIITNGLSDSIQTVQISASDKGFHSEDCGTWTYLGS